ncbi:MAG TPA: hypothetical protein VM223_08045 [Planctomycetota bacterium]|nr:hypothetical protein [Planctomycetota bacterium]
MPSRSPGKSRAATENSWSEVKKLRSQEVKKSRSQEAKKSRSQEAKKPTNQEVRKPRSQELKKSRSQEANKQRNQEAKKSRTQEAKKPRSQEVKKPRSQEVKKLYTASEQIAHVLAMLPPYGVSGGGPPLPAHTQDPGKSFCQRMGIFEFTVAALANARRGGPPLPARCPQSGQQSDHAQIIQTLSIRSQEVAMGFLHHRSRADFETVVFLFIIHHSSFARGTPSAVPPAGQGRC